MLSTEPTRRDEGEERNEDSNKAKAEKTGMTRRFNATEDGRTTKRTNGGNQVQFNVLKDESKRSESEPKEETRRELD